MSANCGLLTGRIFVGSIRDISERKRAENEIQVAQGSRRGRQPRQERLPG